MKKQQKPTHSKDSPFERILIRWIVLLSLSVTISLLVYFRPFTFSDMAHWAQTLYQEAETGITRMRIQTNAYIASRKQAAIARKAAAEAALPPETQEPSSDEDAPIPFLTPSSDLGDISDLNGNAWNYDDEIYLSMLDTAMGPMLYYNQGDTRWKNYLYGGYDPIGSHGCGPTAISMLINSFTPSTVTPIEVADWAAANGYFAKGSGSYHSLIPDGLSAFGLSVESVTNRTPEHVRSILKEGRLLVALMGRGSLTKVGHFIIITHNCDNGNVYIADPNSLSNSTVEWDLQQLMNELKRSYDSGGPLWAVGTSP